MPKTIVINPKNYENTIEKLITAAIEGNVEAKKELEENYRTKDFNHLAIFANYMNKNPQAISRISPNFFDKLTGDILDDIIRIDKKSAEEVFNICQFFANQNASWAHTVLGYFYETGLYNVVPRDIKKAFTEYTAAKSDCPRAVAHLGQLYARGEAIPHNMKIAIELWQNAATNNDALAQALLGHLYCTGYEAFLAKDEKLARTYLTQSMEQNHHSGFALYANYLENTLAELFAKVDDLGSVKSSVHTLINEIHEAYKVAIHYNSPVGNALYGNFLTWTKAATRDQIQKFYDFAVAHFEPKGIAFKARSIFARNSESGYMIKNQMAMNEGFNLIKQVQMQKDPEVCAVLGQLYYMGQGFECNLDKAVEVLNIAAEYENTSALLLLAQIHANPQAIDCSDAYLFKAAKKNAPLAQFMLGMNELNNGNRKNAIKYLVKSARNGFGEALKQLTYLNHQMDKGNFFDIFNEFQIKKYFANTQEKIVHFEEGIIYGEGANGNCGFTALGITRAQACKSLLSNAHDPVVRELSAPEIMQAILTGEFLRLYAQQNDNLRKRLETYDQQIHDGKQDNAELQEFCREEEVFKAFVECYIGGNGWLNSFRDATSTSDAIAYLYKVRFAIWEPTKNKDPLTNEIELHQVGLRPNPEVYNYENQNIFHLLYLDQLGHFNLLYEANLTENFQNKNPSSQNTGDILRRLNASTPSISSAMTTEDEELAAALALSMEGNKQEETKQVTQTQSTDITEDEELEAALAMSLSNQ